ncbi:P-loop containing nucleoside triphosphate hydrolase protein [Rozella allomycis CSF55]|uniref:RNA helicase n=1 Tax=Rozella allomycis (strain CSF55) TaxID=988480 RepID=A0A4P9YHR2_ROZAC|nr:P-loop containing nucleoside triphosphate hydrolase protein [Rozella allomycis CSF55]
MAHFWKPGTVAPGSLIDRESEKETSESLFYNFFSSQLTIEQQRQRLPIYKHKKEILYVVDKYQVVVIVGQTGSGKTTQIPQYLYENGWCDDDKVIACTQPRRIAATSVAARVAEECQVSLGETVGYSIRFEDKTSERTRIKYMTDGSLFREAMMDPLLSKYSVIMVDEAHERSLYTDLLLGLLKKIIKKRPELRILVSSATLDAQLFCDYFTTDGITGTILSVQGRTYPVDVFYLQEKCLDYIECTIETIKKIHQLEGEGDVLCFMTGKDEIDAVISTLKSDEDSLYNNSGIKLLLLPIYAGLPVEYQFKVFEPTPKGFRKVIVATNIAEASVTIDNIVYVVDCGYNKIKIFHPETGLDTLVITRVSRASAKQRAGRAGRLKPGKAYRLYTMEDYSSMSDNSIPEIQRSNMSSVVLQLKSLGIDNIVKFPFMSPPSSEMLWRSLEFLFSLGAINEHGKLTKPLGEQLAELPVDPMLARTILASKDFYCSDDIATIVAMISVQNIFVNPSGSNSKVFDAVRRKFAVEEGDHLTYLNVFRAFAQKKGSSKWCHENFLNAKALNRAVTIRNHIIKYMKRLDIPKNTCEIDTIFIRKCLVCGFFANAAKAQPDGSYKSIKDGITLHIHPNSVLFKRVPPFVIYHDVVHTTKAFMREVTAVDPEWLADLAPHYYSFSAGKFSEH